MSNQNVPVRYKGIRETRGYPHGAGYMQRGRLTFLGRLIIPPLEAGDVRIACGMGICSSEPSERERSCGSLGFELMHTIITMLGQPPSSCNAG